jgi:hypothetical protein
MTIIIIDIVGRQMNNGKVWWEIKEDIDKSVTIKRANNINFLLNGILERKGIEIKRNNIQDGIKTHKNKSRHLNRAPVDHLAN